MKIIYSNVSVTFNLISRGIILLYENHALYDTTVLSIFLFAFVEIITFFENE